MWQTHIKLQSILTDGEVKSKIKWLLFLTNLALINEAVNPRVAATARYVDSTTWWYLYWFIITCEQVLIADTGGNVLTAAAATVQQMTASEQVRVILSPMTETFIATQ